jgi:hypothetical protein
MAARDAARHLRIPGSLNTGSETNVEWWIQGANESGYVYTLPQLAKLFKAIPTKRHHGEVVAHNPAKRRGWVELNAKRLRDFNMLRALRGGFSEGSLPSAAKTWNLVQALTSAASGKAARCDARPCVATATAA